MRWYRLWASGRRSGRPRYLTLHGKKLMQLPHELHVRILAHCALSDLASASRVCKLWDEQRMWRELYGRRWGAPSHEFSVSVHNGKVSYAVRQAFELGCRHPALAVQTAADENERLADMAVRW